jgi:hypothetical protein
MFERRPDLSAEKKKILGAVGVDTVVVALIAWLVVNGFTSLRVVPIVSFCLFWANFVFLRILTRSREIRNSNETDDNWKFLALMTVAGVYFAGAVWGIILFVNEHELYGLLGTVFSTCFGAFCMRKAQKQLVVPKA